MIRGEAEAVIEASPEVVFARLTDHTVWHEWLPGHGGWPDGLPPTVAEGAVFALRLGFFGIHDTVTITVDENRAPSSLVIAADGNFGASARMTFRVTAGEAASTRARAEVEILGAPVRMIAALARKALTQTLSSALQELDAQVMNTQPERNHHVLLR